MVERDALVMHTIYRNPSDYPCLFVVRAWRITARGASAEREPLAVVATLDEARASIPPGSDVRMPGDPLDDPCIVETWL